MVLIPGFGDHPAAAREEPPRCCRTGSAAIHTLPNGLVQEYASIARLRRSQSYVQGNIPIHVVKDPACSQFPIRADATKYWCDGIGLTDVLGSDP